MVEPRDLKPIDPKLRPKAKRRGFWEWLRRPTTLEVRRRREAKLWDKVTKTGYKPAAWEHETYKDNTGKTRRVTWVVLLD